MFHLPHELQCLIFEFDSTYKEIFDKVLQSRFTIYKSSSRNLYFIFDSFTEKTYTTNSLSKPSSKIKRDSIDIKSKTSLVDDWLSITVFDSLNGNPSFAQISLKINSPDNIIGTGTDFNNDNFSFSNLFPAKFRTAV